ncbi:MAG: hypothetical protein HFI74_12100 [Lachnospiraceae bacterium]|nr:hypothetical protein [Lachnospiraceae bacterium]
MAKERMMGTIGQATDMDAFASTVKQMLEQAHPSADVEIQKVSKNNNRTLTGIAIYEAGSNISPNIYLEDFFTEYQAGRPHTPAALPYSFPDYIAALLRR